MFLNFPHYYVKDNGELIIEDIDDDETAMKKIEQLAKELSDYLRIKE